VAAAANRSGPGVVVHGKGSGVDDEEDGSRDRDREGMGDLGTPG